MKRTLLISVLILVATVTIVASTSSSSSLNFLSKLYADTLYQPIVYGEMWNRSGSTTPYTFPIAAIGRYYNLTGLGSDMNEGFTFTSATQALGGSYLTAEVSGRYKVSASVSSAIDVASSALYAYAISHEFDRANHNNCYARRTASSGVGSISINCLMDIEAGTRVNIQIEQETGIPARDMIIHTVNLNLVKVGDIPSS